MYEVLVEMVEPQVLAEITQQTPKPAAQEPEAAPPLLPHSEEVKQVPLVVEELPLVHSSLGNWTTLNRENCSSWRKILLVNSNHVIYFSLCPQ